MKLRGFMGICHYYKLFVKGFSQLVAPLTNLTKTGAFEWTEAAQWDFKRFKVVMSSCSILALLDFSHPFIPECDESCEGIGAVLMQVGHPIAYESRKIRDYERLYSIYDNEKLAIMHAMTKFRN